MGASATRVAVSWRWLEARGPWCRSPLVHRLLVTARTSRVPDCLGGSSFCLLLAPRAVWEAAPPASSSRPGLSGRQLLLPPPLVPGCLGGSSSCLLLASRAVWEAALPASSSRPGLSGRQLLLPPPRVPGCLGGSSSCPLLVSRAVWEAAPPASSSCPGLSGRQRLLPPPRVPGCLGGSASCTLRVSRAVWEAAPPASSSRPGLSGRQRLLHPPSVPGCLGGSSSCILLVFGLRGSLFSTRLCGNRLRLASAARNHTARGVSSGIASRRLRRRDLTPRAVSVSSTASADAVIVLASAARHLFASAVKSILILSGRGVISA